MTHKQIKSWILAAISILGCWLGLLTPAYAENRNSLDLLKDSSYETRSLHNPDGIGKFYVGREIAQVMGHPGAGWLERSTRESEERPARAIAALNLKPTDVVADIGAGSGYFSLRIATKVAEVYAVDIQPKMLERLQDHQAKLAIPNVKTILGSNVSPNLPDNSVDLAIMVDAYHEFEYPHEMMESIYRSLKPMGRVVLLEYKGENPLIMIKGLHKMTQTQVRAELEPIGLHFVEDKRVLPQQHLLVFSKS